MIFGKGKIEMSLEKYGYQPGESVTGSIDLKLKKTVHARGLSVAFRGDLITTRTRRDRDGHMRHERHTTRIYNQKIPLDGEKDYKGGNYDFEIKIPDNILDMESKPDGMLGDALEAMKFMSGRHDRIQWYIVAKLDVPMGLDVSKKQDITIG